MDLTSELKNNPRFKDQATKNAVGQLLNAGRMPGTSGAVVPQPDAKKPAFGRGRPLSKIGGQNPNPAVKAPASVAKQVVKPAAPKGQPSQATIGASAQTVKFQPRTITSRDEIIARFETMPAECNRDYAVSVITRQPEIKSNELKWLLINGMQGCKGLRNAFGLFAEIASVFNACVEPISQEVIQLVSQKLDGFSSFYQPDANFKRTGIMEESFNRKASIIRGLISGLLNKCQYAEAAQALYLFKSAWKNDPYLNKAQEAAKSAGDIYIKKNYPVPAGMYTQEVLNGMEARFDALFEQEFESFIHTMVVLHGQRVKCDEILANQPEMNASLNQKLRQCFQKYDAESFQNKS